MATSAPHRLVTHLPAGMTLWHLVIWLIAVLLAVLWFAGWIQPVL
jgi:hypothetical protein